MRIPFYFLALIPALMVSACNVQSGSGGDIRLEQPFLLSDQSWRMGKQATMVSGDRVCTISAGELDVTQRMSNHNLAVQVGTSNDLAPGDSYKVLIGDHNYETSEGQGWFGGSESEEIVGYMMKTGLIYTETRKSTIEYGHAGPVYRDMDNKIAMDGFAQLYRACKQYVKSTRTSKSGQ